MGGKSSSSSSNSTKTSTTTNQADNRIGAADNGMVATSGGSIVNENVSADVVESALSEAFGFGQEGLALVETAFDAVADLKKIEFEGVIDSANAAKDNFNNLLMAGTAIAGIWFFAKVWK